MHLRLSKRKAPVTRRDMYLIGRRCPLSNHALRAEESLPNRAPTYTKAQGSASPLNLILHSARPETRWSFPQFRLSFRLTPSLLPISCGKLALFGR